MTEILEQNIENLEVGEDLGETDFVELKSENLPMIEEVAEHPTPEAPAINWAEIPHKIINGEPVELSEEELAVIAERERKALEAAPKLELEMVLNQRAENYPNIGDQLDAILKTFDKLSQQNIELPEEMLGIIDQWKNVKETFPKPNLEDQA